MNDTRQPRAFAAQKGNDERGAPALKGVRRALEVLEHLAIHQGRATDVAEALGVSWTTLYRTLSQLEQDGFLARDADTNRYGIGPRMWFIGTSYLTNHTVVEVAQPYLETSIEGIDFTVQLVERSGRLSVVLYSRHTTGEVITKATYGYHFPLHCGSKGQVLLAHAEPDYIDEYLSGDLEKLTPDTETDSKALRAILTDIREQGYARTVADVQRFTGSLAAPVFDRNDRVVASVCFICVRSVFRDEMREALLREELLRTSNSISFALGWRPGMSQTPQLFGRRFENE